ncbi:hypothetical protein B4113_1287 [Geobacillus sp. B4113_201601]|nr:hypothetical protein B4113_1287 [Geobacillus sp. B4113_201601]
MTGDDWLLTLKQEAYRIKVVFMNEDKKSSLTNRFWCAIL